MASLEKRDPGIVVDGFGVHRFDETQIVSNLGGMWQQFTDPRATFAMLFELPI